MRQWILMIAAVSIVGCAFSSDLFKVDYNYQDNPAKNRIDLIFENLSRRSVCLLPEFWPNQAGKVNQASDYIYLVVGQEVFRLRSFNTGYCPSCVTKVQPGEKVEAFLEYEDFGLPKRYFHQPKELVFDLKVYNCN